MNVLMETELRPCEVRTKHEVARFLFHGWVISDRLVPPSKSPHGHKGGVVQDVLALVEHEDGQMYLLKHKDIRFIDDKVKRVFKEGCYDAQTPSECSDVQSRE